MNVRTNIAGRLSMRVAYGFYVIAAILLAMPAPVAAGSVTNRTETVYYDVVGYNYSEILLSVHTRAPRVNGDIALAVLETQISMQAEPARQKSCTLKDASFHLEHRMVLPRLINQGQVSASVSKQFKAFQTALRRHEEEHRAIYKDCIGQMRNLILRLPKDVSCSVYEKNVADVMKFARAECNAKNIALDRRDTRQSANLPIVRHALADIAAGKVSNAMRLKLADITSSSHRRTVGPIKLRRGSDR